MMKPRTRSAIAISLDVLLFVVVLLLFSPRLTGLPLHEWLAIAFALPVMIHLLLSWAWINTATRRFTNRSNARARINYSLNWILFVLIVIEITSGLVISEIAVPFIGIPTINDSAWRAVHNQTLNVTMLLLAFHVAMNWQALSTGLRRHLLRVSAADE